MPREGLRWCRGCGRSTDEVGPLSWTRQCPECATNRLCENIEGLVLHRGPAFDRWRRAMAASVGGVLLDDARPSVNTDARAD